jgi:hypothetical protein
VAAEKERLRQEKGDTGERTAQEVGSSGRIRAALEISRSMHSPCVFKKTEIDGAPQRL